MMIYNQYKRRMASILYIVCFTLPMGIHGQNKQFTLDDLIPGEDIQQIFATHFKTTAMERNYLSVC